jgi:hypothetical protein
MKIFVTICLLLFLAIASPLFAQTEDNYFGVYISNYEDASYSEAVVYIGKYGRLAQNKESYDQDNVQNENNGFSPDWGYGFKYGKKTSKSYFFTEIILDFGQHEWVFVGHKGALMTGQHNDGYLTEEEAQLYCHETGKCAPKGNLSFQYNYLAYVMGFRGFKIGKFNIFKLGVGLSLLSLDYQFDLSYCEIPSNFSFDSLLYHDDGSCVYQTYDKVDTGSGNSLTIMDHMVFTFISWTGEDWTINFAEISKPLGLLGFLEKDEVIIEMDSHDSLSANIEPIAYIGLFKIVYWF